MNRTIYVIGDSHQQSFDKRWYHDPEDWTLKTKEPVYGPDDVIFKVIPLGSWPAYLVPEQDEDMRKALAQVEPGCEVWFMFGEIDCRFHIFNEHLKNNISIDEAISVTIQKYLRYVSLLKLEGYDIHIVSADPAIRAEHLDDPAMIRGNGETDQDRVYITEIFNSELKHDCYQMGIPFVDIYHFLVDPKDGQSRVDLLSRHWEPEKAAAGILDGMHFFDIADYIIEKLGLTSTNREENK